MRLRARIALITLLGTAPMVGGLALLDVHAQQQAAEAELAELVLARIDTEGERERCELDPDSWNRPPSSRRDALSGAVTLPPRTIRGPEPPARSGHFPRGQHRSPARLFVYDAALGARSRGAPPLPHAVAREPVQVLSRSSWLRADQVELLVRTPWPSGSCAYVLALGTTEPWLGALLPPTRIWLAPALMVFAIVLIGIGPVVRRLRMLTESVQRMAAFQYQQPLDAEASRLAERGDELGQLARAFAQAGSEVRSLIAEKDRRERALRDFLADTTHDLAIPLTVLQGHLSSLRDTLSQQAPLDRAALSSAMDEAHYIGALLHNLGAAAKLGAHELALQRSEVELGALVMRVLSRHRPIASEHAVAIDAAIPEQPVRTLADLTLLEQAVSNVVYNAVRHNRSGGHVAIVLSHAEERFRIQVVDDGPGVAPELLAQLGERGFRDARARTRSPEGGGLGLHITRRIVAAHAMELRFVAPEAGGLEVSFEGPAQLNP